VSAAALALALAAAVLHAAWNLLVARAPDSETATAVAVTTAVVAFAPVAALTWDVEAAAVPFVVASSALELAYTAMLAYAYQHVPLSIVYPVARGGAPVLVLLASVLALGVPASAGQFAGVLCVAVGIMLVRGLGRDVPLRSLGLPLAVAATIAGYTLVDRYGIRHASALPYLELVLAGTLVYPLVLLRRRGGAALAAAVRPDVVFAGLALFSAYVLVLAALRLAPPGPVAAVRESSVVIATGFAAVVLGERVDRQRFIGAALVAIGVATLALA
jgi:drug/metabolite transporter (DMT)-like permease